MKTVSDYDQNNYGSYGGRGADGISMPNISRRSASGRNAQTESASGAAGAAAARANAAAGQRTAAPQAPSQPRSSRVQPKPALDVRLNTSMMDAGRRSQSAAAARGQSGTVSVNAAAGRNGNTGRPNQSQSSNTGRPVRTKDRNARARAAARRRKKQRQRMMLLCVSAVAAVVLIAAIVLGISASRKNKQMMAFRTDGMAAMDAGDYETAIINFDSALQLAGKKLGREEYDVLQRRAEAEYNLRDYAAALDSWKILLEQDPNNDAYKKNAVLCMMELGQYEDALQYGVLQSRIYNKMAVEKIQAGDYDGALIYIDRGLGVDDGSVKADLLYNQAVANENRGNYAQALDLFRQYVELYGADENVQKEIDFLTSRVGDDASAANGTEAETNAEGESAAE